MHEKFLHYVWHYQKFNFSALQSSAGEKLQVVQVGQSNNGSGPDFLAGQVYIGSVLFVGAIEIHSQASAWYQHPHHLDKAYDNVILHVI